jgi:hypothetical protein
MDCGALVQDREKIESAGQPRHGREGTRLFPPCGPMRSTGGLPCIYPPQKEKKNTQDPLRTPRGRTGMGVLKTSRWRLTLS